tara:strand:+ start:452 stop:1498 length:1047 start_codon:yes stop_codon:yes gene_type:complete
MINIKEKKKIGVVYICIFPEGKNKNYLEKYTSLINQIEMTCISIAKLQNLVDVVIISNETKKIRSCNFIKNFNSRNLRIIKLENNDLKICNSNKNKQFQYTFSKIDCLEIIEKLFVDNHGIDTLVLSDIDTIFLDINKIFNFSRNIKNFAAIDYRNEHPSKINFDNFMSDLISKTFSFKDQKKIPKKLSWINSGFMIIRKDFLRDLKLMAFKSYEFISTEKERAEKDMHWTDEVVFSAIFNYVKGIPIKNKNGQIARFIWTCNVDLPYFINPFFYPSHIHLPAIKWNNMQMKLLNKLAKYPNYKFNSIFFINLWSLLGRINSKKSKILVYKIIIKTVTEIEKFIVHFF